MRLVDTNDYRVSSGANGFFFSRARELPVIDKENKKKGRKNKKRKCIKIKKEASRITSRDIPDPVNPIHVFYHSLWDEGMLRGIKGRDTRMKGGGKDEEAVQCCHLTSERVNCSTFCRRKGLYNLPIQLINFRRPVSVSTTYVLYYKYFTSTTKRRTKNFFFSHKQTKYLYPISLTFLLSRFIL